MNRHDAQRFLMQQLREDGDPREQQAKELEALYHAREMAGLSEDAYSAALGQGVPPRGWARASERPELVRALLSGSELTDDELRDLLKPDRSGFRAEIYIPDPDVLVQGYKPTLAFKGSAGEVIASDGSRRDTTAEDFLGNNFPQSIGMATEYYDRGMDLAMFLKQQGLDFDITGHSLAGGTASAASAVTGMRAVTFNAAGLHRETVVRFASQNNGMLVYDTNQTVTAWQVQGDLLNDGIQGDLANLGVLERHRLAGLLSDTAAVMRKVPEARQMLNTQLMAGIPESSHPAIQSFLDRLEKGDGAALLRDLPQAAGVRKPPLVAMQAGEAGPVPRDYAASVGELHRLAGPLLNVVASAARGADAGSTAGQVAAFGGRIANTGLDLAGDGTASALGHAGTFAAQGYGLAGVTVEHGTRAMGEVAARWRETAAATEAGAHRAHGWLQEQYAGATASGSRVLGAVAGLVSPQLQRDLETRAEQQEAQGRELLAQSRAEAAQALQQGRGSAGAIRLGAGSIGAALHDDIARVGERARERVGAAATGVDATLDGVGDRVAGVTSRAPLAGATVGGTTGLLVGAAVSYQPGTPWTAYSVQGTVELARQAGPAMHESLQRHGMASAVIPSLDGEIARQEEAARALLRAQERERSADDRQLAPAQADRPLLYMGESGRALDRFMDAVQSGDGARISAASAALLDTKQAQDWLEAGRTQLEEQPWGLAPVAGQVAEGSPVVDAALAR
ncbi:hypothetical protein ACW5EG_01190 [Luteimonas sp. A611]